MERRNYNYIPPSSLNLLQQQPHYLITSHPTAIHHHHLQSQLTENQLLAETDIALKQELSVSKTDLCHLSAVSRDIEAARELYALVVNNRTVEMESEVKLINESNAELAQMLGELKKLRSDKEQLDQKLNEVLGEVMKMSLERRRIRLLKVEIEKMQTEIERERGLIEHEKRVYASNIKQKQEMNKFKIILARKIEKMKVEASDAEKRARAAAAVEAALKPGTGYAVGYRKPEMGLKVESISNITPEE